MREGLPRKRLRKKSLPMFPKTKRIGNIRGPGRGGKAECRIRADKGREVTKASGTKNIFEFYNI
jgi:hypothetical protein